MAVKVKQSTIDEIKKMGMTKALASAKTRRSPEWQEALRRMYGQRRLDAAKKGAQGGSQPRETYMYRGTPGTKKKTTAGRSTPGAPAGTGARQVANRKKPTSRNRAGAMAGAAAGAAAGVATGRSLSRKVKAGQAAASGATKKTTAAAKAAAARNVMPKQNLDIAKGMLKFAGTKAGRGVGRTARALTGSAARRTGAGLAALTAYELAKEAKTKANKAGRKVQAAGSGRAAAIKKSRGK